MNIKVGPCHSSVKPFFVFFLDNKYIVLLFRMYYDGEEKNVKHSNFHFMFIMISETLKLTSKKT
jgi:hypothetical protein